MDVPSPRVRRRRSARRAARRRNDRRHVARRCACCSAARRSSSAISSSSAGSSAAVLGQRITPYDPFNDYFAGHLPPSPEHWFGHRPARARRPVAGHGRIARRPHRRAAGGSARGHRGHVARPRHGLLPRPRRRRPQPDRRGLPRPAGHPRRAADAGRARVLAARRHLRRRDPVHADRGTDGPLGSAVGARARLRHGGQAARRDGTVHPVARDLPERARADGRRDDRPFRLRDLHRRHAVVPRRRPPAALARLGPERRRGVPEHDLGRLVAHPLPGHRHRQHGHRRQPDRGLAPVGRSTNDDRADRAAARPHPPPRRAALRVEDLSLAYVVRGIRRPSCAACRSRSGPASRMGWSASPAAASPRRPTPRSATCRATRSSPAAGSSSPATTSPR